METFTIHGKLENHFLHWFAGGLKDIFTTNGYQYCNKSNDNIRLVFNFIDTEKPRPFRRKAQATFVVSVLETNEKPNNVLKAAYPYLIRSLSNHLIYIFHDQTETNICFLTPEQGCYQITFRPDDNKENFFQLVYRRLKPLASSHLGKSVV